VLNSPQADASCPPIKIFSAVFKSACFSKPQDLQDFQYFQGGRRFNPALGARRVSSVSEATRSGSIALTFSAM